jgi:hypothetical protein
MTNGLLKYDKIFAHFLIYNCIRSHLNFLIYEENFILFFISVVATSLISSMVICSQKRWLLYWYNVMKKAWLLPYKWLGKATYFYYFHHCQEKKGDFIVTDGNYCTFLITGTKKCMTVLIQRHGKGRNYPNQYHEEADFCPCKKWTFEE